MPNQLKNTVNKINVTVKPLITVNSFFTYQSIVITKILLKSEANTQ